MEQLETDFTALFTGGDMPEPHARLAILRFTTIFSLYEAKLCSCEASQSRSADYAKEFLRLGFRDVETLSDVFQHCKKRYFPGGEESSNFKSLCGYRSDGKKPATPKFLREAITNIFQHSEPTLEDKLTVCLFFCFRLRNNLFHGPKWNHNINYQSENLNLAADLLLSILLETKEKSWSFYK
ncbi:hypothetical protein [Klebsiella oxytoca]|uniref:hypothetical protein n=1 Tax=Klebsiella oxytoca TaxID=571 RepID=UPI001EEBCFF9|nr:hypothetical protein [Klebsiella oxytoca]